LDRRPEVAASFWGCPTYPKCRQTFKIDGGDDGG
jgi:hypothetical protein